MIASVGTAGEAAPERSVGADWQTRPENFGHLDHFQREDPVCRFSYHRDQSVCQQINEITEFVNNWNLLTNEMNPGICCI